MRKILLATSALVAFAGAAQAAESPISVNVGGYVDFRAGHFQESEHASNMPSGRSDRRNYDFETEWMTTIDAVGKGNNGIEYGGTISFWNGSEFNDSYVIGSGTSGGGANVVREREANVWMTGAWGKAVLGDTTGATDLFVMAPTVGEGQIAGSYTDFTDASSLAQIFPTYLDATETNTKVKYFTPKVGNENHKLQLGASYTPNWSDVGQRVVKYDNASYGSYQDVFEGTAQYTGKWGNGITTRASALIAGGSAEPQIGGTGLRDFVSWGFGGDAAWNGFTLGASYVNAGDFATLRGGVGNEDKAQDSWTVGLKYEFDKVALAANYQNASGYQSFTTLVSRDYAEYDAVGLGATYTWFKGLTSAVDAVLFSQERDDAAVKDNDGHVVMLTQKIAF